MIYASGVVTFLSSNKKFTRKKNKSKTIALEFIEEIHQTMIPHPRRFANT